MIGAPGNTASAGKSYVVFGRAGLGSSGSFALSSLNGTNGFVLNGENANDFSGGSVASAGDVNDDGIADLVIGAWNAISAAGKSYVVFGRAGLGSSGSLALSSLNGTNGFVLNGDQMGDQSGHSVASAGDVNDDGIADLVIGAFNANSYAGKSYVVFGLAGLGSSGGLALSSLNGTSGFVLNGEQADDESGYSVASAGDVNDDGIADLVIGAYNANSYAGKSYVVFGRAGLGSTGNLALSSLNGTTGFVLNGGPGDESGLSVASAGDVNGDGIADLVIGAPYANNSHAGKSYVVFGRKLSNATFLTTLPPTPRSITSTLSLSAQPTPLTTPLTPPLVPGTTMSQLTTLTGLTTPSSQSMPVGQSGLSSSTLTIPLTTGLNPLTSLSISNSLGSTNVVASTRLLSRANTSSAMMNPFSQTATTFSPVGSIPTGVSLPVIIGLTAAVAALACSLLGVGLYFVKRKRNSKNSIEVGTGLGGDSVLPAGYTSIETIQQGLA